MIYMEKLKEKCHRFTSKLNVTYVICDHLLGENHKSYHRLIVGTLIIFLGVVILHSTAAIGIMVVRHSIDTGAIIMHCVGGTPWIEELLKSKKINNL